MALDQKDVELIERVIYKNSDDVAVSIARSFERLEQRIDAIEARFSARVAETENKLEWARNSVEDNIESLRDALRG